MRMIRRLLIGLILLAVLLLGLLFALQNDAPVTLDLLVVQLTERPVAVWVLVAFVLGGVLGLLASSIAIVRLRSSRAALQRRLARCEEDLSAARSLPPVAP